MGLLHCQKASPSNCEDRNGKDSVSDFPGGLPNLWRLEPRSSECCKWWSRLSCSFHVALNLNEDMSVSSWSLTKEGPVPWFCCSFFRSRICCRILLMSSRWLPFKSCNNEGHEWINIYKHIRKGSTYRKVRWYSSKLTTKGCLLANYTHSP